MDQSNEDEQNANEIVLELNRKFNMLSEICQPFVTDDPNKYNPSQVESLETILESLEQLDFSQMEEFNQLQNGIAFLKEHLDLATTEWYLQKLVENDHPKREAVRVAVAHLQSVFPNGKLHKQRIQNCKLQSMEIKQIEKKKQYCVFSRYLNEKKHFRSKQSNCLLPLNQRYNIEGEIKNETLIHVSIFHPFNKKKTQEIIILGKQTLRDLSKLIKCIVEKTEKQHYSEEYEEIKDDVSFDIDKDLDRALGDIAIKICKKYNYKHLLQCNHWIVFHEIRPMGKYDCKDLSQYENGTIKTCEGCDRVGEIFRVREDRPTNDCCQFLCESCENYLFKDKNSSIAYIGH